MKKQKSSILLRILICIVSVLFLVPLAACGGAPNGEVPAVSNVTLTAQAGELQGKVGTHHVLSYSAPDGSKISVSVTKDSAVATANEFTYTQADGTVVFYVPGNYTVTVLAAKDGMLGSGKADITITSSTGVSVKNLAVNAAAGAKQGAVDAVHVVRYEVSNGANVSVSVTLNGSAAGEEDYEYDASTGRIVFHKLGSYEVTVTAAIGDEAVSKTVPVTITSSASPNVTLTAAASTLQEGGNVKLTHSVSFASGDSLKREGYSVEYKPTQSGSYESAASSYYTMSGDTFAPHVAGIYRVSYSAYGTQGSLGTAVTEITVTATPVTLSKGYGITAWNRIGVNVQTELPYVLSGAADRYEMSFDTHGDNRITATKGAGNTVRLVASEVDSYSVTITCTHRANASISQSVTYNVYAVSDTVYAPVFGEDPFDNLPRTVLTSMGHQLYFDAQPAPNTVPAGAQRSFTNHDVKYEVVEQNITNGGEAKIRSAADNEEYPYVIVENFSDSNFPKSGNCNNSATGTFKIKMTVTDPATGGTAAVTQEFTVRPTNPSGANNTASNTLSVKVQEYVAEFSGFYQVGAVRFDTASSDSRQNMVLTKSGVVIQRTNPDWSLHNDDRTNENSAFAYLGLDAASTSCRLDFTMKVLGLNDGKVWLGIGVYTNTASGWNGYLNVQSKNGVMSADAEMSHVSEIQGGLGYTEIPAAVGTTMYFRLERQTVENNAVYTLLVKTSESGEYCQMYRYTAAASQNAGNTGAPVVGYQLTHRNGGGCYLIENVTLTDLV